MYFVRFIGDESDRLYLVARYNDQLFMYVKEPGDDWKAPILVSDTYQVVDQHSIGLSLEGIAILWGPPVSPLFVTFCSLSSCSEPREIFHADIDTTPFTKLVVPGSQGRQFIWNNINGIRGLHIIPSGDYEDLIASQQVTIPLTYTQPTLSFFYRQAHSAPEVGNGLQVLISSTLIFSASQETDWTHAWLDLSPWAGQTVSVTFQSHQVAGYPYVELALDEISLGSAYPDGWIDLAGPSSALPGEIITYTLHFGVRGGLLPSTTLTVTLPAGLQWVNASLLPTQQANLLVWELGDLEATATPDPIQVSLRLAEATPPNAWLSLTASIGADTLDWETENNLSYARVFVGARLFLPLTRR